MLAPLSVILVCMFPLSHSLVITVAGDFYVLLQDLVSGFLLGMKDVDLDIQKRYTV